MSRRDEAIVSSSPPDGTPTARLAVPPRELQVSRRERGKLERRRRIEDAARETFRAKGYEGATTREIAERADVGKGTLFSYARDKRELLMMLVNADLDAITETTFATLPVTTSLLEQLVHLFAPRYAFWARDPSLSRHVVRETFAYFAAVDETDRSTETARFHSRQPRMLAKIAEIVDAQQRAGAIARREGSEIVAELIWDIYLSENRNWLAQPEPDVTSGVEHLRRILALAIDGLKP
jgi:AcrR family transcriptional regulator